MADKKAKTETFKEYTVNKKSVGSQLSWGGKAVILNNGLPQSTLKALYAKGLVNCITKNVK